MIRYAITDPSFFTTQKEKQNYLNNVKADYVLFRDKVSKTYKEQASDFLNFSQNMPFKRILHSDYKLAHELKADGVHLTSNQFNEISKAKELGLWTVISTHTLNEIEQAQKLGANAVTFSPIFTTPNKGTPKGIEELKKAIDSYNIDIIALGGIVTQEHINLVKETKAFGFASIRYFLR